jgi:pimeloyl-ACP methyl ester carboxylesterase
MDAPPIQYARTQDGVNIAYTRMGEGSPLVYLQPYTHQQLDWTIPEMRGWFEMLSRDREVIRFDMRRFGLSQRTTSALSLETYLSDLSAVVDHLQLDQFDLMGISGQAVTAIAFAAAPPKRVRRLILWGGAAFGAEFAKGSPRMRAVNALWDIDPDLAREVTMRGMFGEDAMLRPGRKFECGSVSTPGNPSPRTATTSAAPCSWRRVSVTGRSRGRCWWRRWCGTSVGARRSPSRTKVRRR